MVLLWYFTMNITLSSSLTIQMKHIYRRSNGALYYQRKIPLELVDRYPSAGSIKINLHTKDEAVAAVKISKLDREHEALWNAMRKDPTLSPVSSREETRKVLLAAGLDSAGRGDERALAALFDAFDRKREQHADKHEEAEEVYREASPSEFLSKPEVEALKVIRGAGSLLMSDATELYLEEHEKRGKPGFDKLEAYTRRVMAKARKLLGDKALESVTRDDAKTLRDSLLATIKTESVKRNLNVVKAVFSKTITEKSLNIPNVWNKLTIAGLGEDTEERESFTRDELVKLQALCKAKDDAIRWIPALQSDTGARLAEVVGLALEDIHLDAETPYLDIRPHPWRTLKTENSPRLVPLVGASLWAARRVIETAQAGQFYAFPRYIKEGKKGKEAKATAASATINKWMENAGLPHTTHELRHTMRDRLRDAGATKDIQDAIGGWGKNTLGQDYGRGYMLKTLRDQLLKTVLESPEEL